MRALDAVAGWPVGAAAAGVVHRPPPAAGPQPAGPPAGGPQPVATTGDVDRPFRWASVTKLCTALAVLVAVEEGTVALDDPAGPPGSTVAHLLAHASGLAPSGDLVLAAPGRRRIYSNAGFDVVGQMLADRSGLPFVTYLRDAVLDPLGMGGTRMAPDGSPGSGLVGTVRDLLALGGQLLAPTLVDPATLGAATAVAFPGLAGVLPGFGRQDPCDWGLGFEIRDGKRPHWTGAANSPATFGHFGQAGGFLWVDPEAGLACAALSDRDFGPWAAEAWPALSDAVLAEAGAGAGGGASG
ncbi:MAG TPA: serine hydrolase domain-containing protein [Acidimicrobiales bacterium]|nr:serine hydrolase domain-containing protein [Acidimicrobiales bacterium]